MRSRRSRPASFLTLTSGMVLTKHVLEEEDEGRTSSGNVGDSRIYRHELRGEALEDRLIKTSEGAKGEGTEESSTANSVTRVSELTAVGAALSADGKCLVVACRATLGKRGPNDGPVEEEEEGKMYLLRCSLDVEDAQTGHELDLRLDDIVWLDRYASDDILGGNVECAGLICRAEEGTDSRRGGYVAYSLWHNSSAASDLNGSCDRYHDAVTVSAAKFAPISAHIPVLPRTTDVDLPPDVVPSILLGAVGCDPSSEGAVLLSMTGCVVDVRVNFPPEPSITNCDSVTFAETTTVAEANLKEKDARMEEEVQAMASHALSAFASYRRRKRRAARLSQGTAERTMVEPNPATHLPPSLRVADQEALALMAERASVAIIDGRGLNGTTWNGTAVGAREVGSTVEGKIESHAEFVNFLVRTGLYRRIKIEGRIRLRDHGEMAAAVVGAVKMLDVEIDKNRGGGGSKASPEEGWMSALSDFLSDMVSDDSGAGAITSLPARLEELQSSFVAPNSTSAAAIDHMPSLLCTVINSAIKYRVEKSDILYDVPASPAATNAARAAPWTSRPELLAVLTRQLELVRNAPIANTSNSNARSKKVEVLAMALLNGHAAIPSGKVAKSTVVARNENLYDAAKRLAVSLVRGPCKDESMALRMSLRHAHFEGIVSICVNNTRHVKMEGDNTNSEFDLRRILRGVSKSITDPAMPRAKVRAVDAALYRSIANTTDLLTGLPFARFALRWHVNRGMIGSALDLGNICPAALKMEVEEDSRLADYRWIQRTRARNLGGAAAQLLGMASSVRPSMGGLNAAPVESNRGTPSSLEDRKLLLSLAKLADGLATNKVKERGESIDRGLLLVQVQESLREEVNAGRDDDLKLFLHLPLNADRLVDASIQIANRAAERGDQDRAVRACLAGLAAAEATGGGVGGGAGGAAQLAAKIWIRAVLSNADVWSWLGGEGGQGVSEDERAKAMEDTLFFCLSSEYCARKVDADGGNTTTDVGFMRNALVRGEVLSGIGLKEGGLEDLLMGVAAMSTTLPQP